MAEQCESTHVRYHRFDAHTLHPAFAKQTLVNGKPASIQCIDIGGQTFVIQDDLVSMLSLEEEWYEDLADPEAVIQALQKSSVPPADIFTFWQRIPDVGARYPYRTEWEEIAVLQIQSYDQWWKNQIKSRVRNQIRKAEKDGLVVKEVPYDDVRKGNDGDLQRIPVRQGRPFWHYGKSFETVKSQFSRYLHRERMIGAYSRRRDWWAS